MFAFAMAVFVWLFFWHFVADWILQREYQAKCKTRNGAVRLQHSLEYALVLSLAMFFVAPFWCVILGFLILVSSHYYIDSYKLTYNIMKYVSRNECAKSLISLSKEFGESPTHLINMIKAIVVDQTLHAFVLILISLLVAIV
jgi:hypothetical protein